jgi:phenylacetate-CoA ligase
MNIELQMFEKNKSKILQALRNAEDTPYYSKMFSQLGIEVNAIKTYDEFQQIPLTSKSQYRNNYIDFVNTGIIDEKVRMELLASGNNYTEKDRILTPLSLEIYMTSGSTGIPLEIIRHSRDMIKNYGILNQYRRKQGDLKAFDNYVWILPESFVSRKYIFNQEEPFFRHTQYGYIGCIAQPSNEMFQQLAEFLYTNKITSIISWPSLLTHFSEYILKNGMAKYIQSIHYLECNSEPLLEWQINKIRNVFSLWPVNVYSGNETNFISGTCTYNKMHVFDENVFLELIENEWGVKETVITNLNCEYTALIRYNLGDVAEWDTTGCFCDLRQDYKIQLKHYRSNDMVVARDGRKYEFNIISDVLHFIQKEYSIAFDKYKVVQIQVDEFILYIGLQNPAIPLENISSYFINYMEQVLGYKITVSIVKKEDDWKEFNFQGKYRYFECRI